MRNLEAARDEIKAAAEACEGTPTAKFVSVLMAAGITDTKEIAAIIGVSDRAVQKARKANHSSPNSRTPNHSSRTTVRTEPQFANHSSEANHSSSENEPQFAKCPRAPARIETPSGLLSQLEIYSPPSVPPKPKTAAKRGSRLPSDWTLPAEWRNWAEVNFAYATDDQIAIEADKFRDYWVAKPRDATKLDWFATWKNWCRTAFGSPRGRAPYNAGRMAYDERKARSRNSQPPAVHLAWLKNPPTAEELEAIRA